MKTTPRNRTETHDGIEATLFSEGDNPKHASVAVRPVGFNDCSHAVVRLFYRLTLQPVRLPVITTRDALTPDEINRRLREQWNAQSAGPEASPTVLTLSMVDVVPLVGNAFSMTTFMVPLADVAFVRVEPVQSCGQSEFFREAEDAGAGD
jgi:hypothetical protein